MWEKIYQMKLGDVEIKFPNNKTKEILLRVPGGWVYIYSDMEGSTSSFIPFNNEFQDE
jgi:hypothetical protein